MIGEVYRHYKGNMYKVIAIGKHSETLEEMVVYQAQYGSGEVWVRPLKMWNEDVLVDGQITKRFSRVLNDEVRGK